MAFPLSTAQQPLYQLTRLETAAEKLDFLRNASMCWPDFSQTVKLQWTDSSGPNEQRCIYRESCSFYCWLVVGATYELPDAAGFDPRAKYSFHAAIKSCIDEHPFLSVEIVDVDVESPKPSYQRTPKIYIDENHLVLVEETARDSAIEGLVEELLHEIKWKDASPPWSIHIMPMEESVAKQKRFFAAFVYSHALGDGISGLAFHRTFLKSLMTKGSGQSLDPFDTPKTPLPGPFDSSSRLPISWTYLLAPFLAVYMPKFITGFFGLQAAASTVDSGTWLGPPIFFDATQTMQTRIKIITIEHDRMHRVLQACRKNEAKLTGTLHQIILHALKIKLPSEHISNFVSQTAINMRGSIGASSDEMGLFVSGYYEVHQKSNIGSIGSESFWQAARHTTVALAKGAATLADQPIGLLRFLPSIRSWTKGKLGQKRDSSYEISNLGVFQPPHSEAKTKARISKMVFAQPANITGAPLAFNFISVQGADLVCTVSWQIGALGLGDEEERPFVDDICALIQESFHGLS
jgi:hypothetical protein